MPSTTVGRGKLIEGIILANAVPNSLEPVRSLNSLALITSMGCNESVLERLSERVPVTTMVCAG